MKKDRSSDPLIPRDRGKDAAAAVMRVMSTRSYYCLDCCDLDLSTVHQAGGQRESIAHFVLLGGRTSLIALLSPC